MQKSFIPIFSLLMLFFSNLAVPTYWNKDSLCFVLPSYMQNLKDELTVTVSKKGQVEINVPRKAPSYWLKPSCSHSDTKIANFFANANVKQADSKDFKKLIGIIKKEYPHLKGLYESPSYITEDHSLEQHTLNVLNQFNEQKKFYSIHAPYYKKITHDMEKLMIATILVHDIGKPLGARNEQHKHTVPIAKEALKRWGFTRVEIDFALTLIDNDIIGELVQPKYKMKVKDAYNTLSKLSSTVGLSMNAYFEMQMLFFVSDASSYPFIRAMAFTECKKNKSLYPTSKKFWNLALSVNKKWLIAYKCFIAKKDASQKKEVSEKPKLVSAKIASNLVALNLMLPFGPAVELDEIVSS
ncbi:MAG: HD domain-containing protein [Candidatus Dependentiae bacterium]